MKKRKDARGRALREGESQRSDNLMYIYTYRDPDGIRRYVYAKELVRLREREEEIQRAQLDGLNAYTRGRATVNAVFDRYMVLKRNIRDNTRANYNYMYDRFIRDGFGKRIISNVKYSDVVQFYNSLLEEEDLAVGTLSSVQGLLHPTFEMAVRDRIIHANPANGAFGDVIKASEKTRGKRKALTPEEQEVFVNFLAEHPIYCRWWPLFSVLLGTGMRIGECLGLTWKDIDFEKGLISINHALAYCTNTKYKAAAVSIREPKTDAGIRTIPMLESVKEALTLQKELQEGMDNSYTLDGYTDFVFLNRYGRIMRPPNVNRVIEDVCELYNAGERKFARRERREPVLLPDFSCHHLRHTFATRLCQVETNLKVIQSIMGHRNIETTMDVYAECTEGKKLESFGKLQAEMAEMF